MVTPEGKEEREDISCLSPHPGAGQRKLDDRRRCAAGERRREGREGGEEGRREVGGGERGQAMTSFVAFRA